MAPSDRADRQRQLRHAHWLTAGGAAAELVGAAWDGLLHHFDPELAAREGPFSVGNPSHLLIFLGLGAIVLGVCWTSARSSERVGLHPFRGPTLPATVLIGLCVTTGAVVLVTGSSHGGHGTRLFPERTDGALRSDRVLVAELKGVLAADGVRAAVAYFRAGYRRDERLQLRSHTIVHELGRLAYAHYGDVTTAFRRCPRYPQGACYHGALQAYFADVKGLGARGLPRFCDRVVPKRANNVMRFECVHGLGHGLFELAGAETVGALRYCDRLHSMLDRNHCYGGVFMERIVRGAGGHSHGAGTSNPDLGAPCDAMPVRSRPECHIYRPLAILNANAHDFAKGFEACEKPPEAPYVKSCHRGMGGQVEVYALGQPKKARRLCMLARPGHRPACFGGVARALVAEYWRTREAVQFCGLLPEEARSSCFEIVASLVSRYPGSKARARAECQSARDESWAAICMRATRSRSSYGRPPLLVVAGRRRFD